MSKFYLNSVDRRDLISIHGGHMMKKKSNDWIFLNKKKHFLSLVFKPAPLPWQQHTP